MQRILEALIKLLTQINIDKIRDKVKAVSTLVCKHRISVDLVESWVILEPTFLLYPGFFSLSSALGFGFGFGFLLPSAAGGTIAFAPAPPLAGLEPGSKDPADRGGWWQACLGHWATAQNAI